MRVEVGAAEGCYRVDGALVVSGQEDAPALDPSRWDGAYSRSFACHLVLHKRTARGYKILSGHLKRNFGCPSLRFGNAFEVTVCQRPRLRLATGSARFTGTLGPSEAVL